MRRLAAALLTIAAATIALLALASGVASAHAQLLETSPATGAVVASEPRTFAFTFDQTVQGGTGAVRVYDTSGRRVDDEQVSHPRGRPHSIAVGLQRGLPDGTYIATYRVVSLDTHVVSGGAVFSIGHAAARGSLTVAGLLSRSRTGRVTLVGFGAVRALGYITFALFAGMLAFLWAAWARAAAAAGPADEALRRRVRAALLTAALLGLLDTLLAFGFQGAEQAGVGFFAALKGNTLEAVLQTRFGTWWGIRALAWALLLALALVATPRTQRRTAWAAASGAGAATVLVTIVLSGHAYSQSPRGLLIALDLVHLSGMSIWLGGLVALLAALPAATRLLAPPARARLLTSVLERFSPLALGSVAALAATGGVQAYIHVKTVDALWSTGYGNDVLAKTGLLGLLLGLGYTQRNRLLPALRRLAGAGESAGATGFRVRRVLRLEVLAVLAAIGVSAALVDYTPPAIQQSGPVNVTRRVGPAELEMTVEPAAAGANEIHIYLLDAVNGSPYAAAREVTLEASLPARAIGPQRIRLEAAGPGHYVAAGAVLAPAGQWQLQLRLRISEFEQFTVRIGVPVR